jgi:hypothetical protein
MTPGTEVLRSICVMPRVYENSDSIDNRASGLFWGMGKGHSGTGVLLDASSRLVVGGGMLSPRGATPAIVVDARHATLVDFPAWKDPGKQNPRQNAAFVGAMVHVLREGMTYELQDGTVVGVESEPRLAPEGPLLNQNYPNPFNSRTVIGFRLAASGHVRLRVYDLLGREVASLLDEDMSGGDHQVTFDAGSTGENRNGRALSSGVYLYRLETGGRQATKRLFLVK